MARLDLLAIHTVLWQATSVLSFVRTQNIL